MDSKWMTTENKKVQEGDFEQSYRESYSKNKIGKSLNANEKSLVEFYLGFTLAVYFRKLREQESLGSPLDRMNFFPLSM